MSRVYIKDFKMPKSCKNCKFCSGYDTFAYCDIAEFAIDKKSKGRSEICPLREGECETDKVDAGKQR